MSDVSSRIPGHDEEEKEEKSQKTDRRKAETQKIDRWMALLLAAHVCQGLDTPERTPVANGTWFTAVIGCLS